MSAALSPLMDAAATLGRLLLEASLVGAVFVGLIWLATRLVPRMPARVRCGLWWLAAAKLLLLLAWTSPVELALLPTEVTTPPSLDAPASSPIPHPPASATAAVPAAAALTATAVTDPAIHPREATASDTVSRSPSGGWLRQAAPGALALFALLWVVGALWQLARLTDELRSGARLVARSEPLERGPVADLYRRLAGRLGLARTPDLRLSDDASSPQALGTFSPRVVLPRPGLERFSRDEIAMTLCHELAHVRRWDLALGWVPALAERLFFFHPLAALAAREYSLAREAACDALVVEVLGTAPRDYGRLILRWGVTPRETGLAAASASPSFAILKRRLEMLQQPHNENPRARHRAAWWSAAVVAVLGLVPFTIVAQSPAPAAEPAPEAPTAVVAPAPETPPAPPEAVTTPAPEAPVLTAPRAPVGATAAPTPSLEAPDGTVLPAPPAPLPDGLPSPPESQPTLAPVPSAHPLPETPAPPRVAAMAAVGTAVWAGPGEPTPRPERRSSSTWSYSTDEDGPSYVYLEGDSAYVMNGSWNTGDADALRSRHGIGDGPLLLAERDGVRYLIQDAATLDRVRQAFAPQRELGDRQSEIGDRQSDLGDQQSELGDRMSALGDRMATADREKREELSDQMRELGDRMRELGERQRELGNQQWELGERQRAAAETAHREIEGVVTRAIDSGVARRVD
jgi:beta-lactamase regulating signal transducer with metallopeptidase domain